MSYILDALKKAERERGIAEVPTLSTVHDLRTPSSVRLWAASGIAILCLAAIALFFVNMLNPDPDLAEPPTEQTIAAASQIREDQVKPVAAADESSNSNRPPGPSPVLTNQPVRPSTGIAGEETDSIKPESVSSTSAATVAEPVSRLKEEPAQETAGLLLPQESRIPGRSGQSELTNAPAGDQTASLREDVVDLSISLLLFSDNAEERLVFINGRKYLEGDTVEERFLLESITQEGAVLSSNGERILLRPGQN
jgi:general secretion pathway protein B